MKTKNLISASIIASISVFAIMYFFAKTNVTDKHMSPEGPYEDYLLQRTYPNKIFDINGYKNALNSAVVAAEAQSKVVASDWQLEGQEILGVDLIA